MARNYWLFFIDQFCLLYSYLDSILKNKLQNFSIFWKNKFFMKKLHPNLVSIQIFRVLKVYSWIWNLSRNLVIPLAARGKPSTKLPREGLLSTILAYYIQLKIKNLIFLSMYSYSRFFFEIKKLGDFCIFFENSCKVTSKAYL